MRRQAPKIGMTYMDANRGRLVSVEDDVLNIKRTIEDRWPSLRVYLDKDNFSAGYPPWIITEIDKRGTESLVCEVEALDNRVIRRLEEADQYVEDALDRMDRYNAAVEREQEHKFMERMGEAHDRLLHAMRQDGLTSPKISISNHATK